MQSVNSQAQTCYVSAASAPARLVQPRPIDLSEFCNPNNIYQPFKDFCQNGVVPESEAIQSMIASCCLKYRAPQVLAALLGSGKVKSLDLSGTFLDARGAQDLAILLENNSTLQRICLADNDFETEGFQAICGALEENSTLVALDLSRNDATGPQYVEAIARMVKTNRTLQILELGFSRIDAEKLPILVEALEENQTLTQLGLGFNLIGPEGICTILKIAETKHSIKVLDLSGNKIGPEGGKLIADILKNNTTLSELDLAYNYLGPDGANAILNAIRSNPTLRSLSLSCNQLDGSNANSIAAMLGQNTALSALDFSCNQLFFPAGASGKESIDSIVGGLEHNTTMLRLNISHNHPDTQAVFERPIEIWRWSLQQRRDDDIERVDILLERNRTFNALSEKDADLASRVFPGQRLSLDEGKLLAGAMVMAAASPAAYEATMVEIQCCLNLLA